MVHRVWPSSTTWAIAPSGWGVTVMTGWGPPPLSGRLPAAGAAEGGLRPPGGNTAPRGFFSQMEGGGPPAVAGGDRLIARPRAVRPVMRQLSGRHVVVSLRLGHEHENGVDVERVHPVGCPELVHGVDQLGGALQAVRRFDPLGPQGERRQEHEPGCQRRPAHYREAGGSNRGWHARWRLLRGPRAHRPNRQAIL